MNSTILNYPGFQTLSKPIKRMLLVSEEHFFQVAQPKLTGRSGRNALGVKLPTQKHQNDPGSFGKPPLSMKSMERLP
jgi:1,6-anhydro-N-acetylmuramate kinase